MEAAVLQVSGSTKSGLPSAPVSAAVRRRDARNVAVIVTSRGGGGGAGGASADTPPDCDHDGSCTYDSELASARGTGEFRTPLPLAKRIRRRLGQLFGSGKGSGAAPSSPSPSSSSSSSASSHGTETPDECKREHREPPASTSTSTSTAASALELVHAVLSTQPPDTNVFFSPASLQAALGAAALAATPGSATAAELLRTFGSAATTLDDALTLLRATSMVAGTLRGSGTDSALHVANALFVARDGGVKPEFAVALQTRMNAQARTVRSAADVNAWCASQTRGAISHILDDAAISPETVMLLVNAVLFRGRWKFAFRRSETVPGVWNALGDYKPRVSYMNRHFEDEREHLYAGIVGAGAGAGALTRARVVRVPYTAPNMEAWFILPTERGAAAFAAVGDALPRLWHEIDALNSQTRKLRPVYFTCPRFNLDTGTVNMVPALQRLGVAAAFEPQGGFLNATDSRLACITGVVQRVTCTVDEEGTVAAACTAICCEDGAASDDEDTFSMVLDRPFWMAVVVRQNLTLPSTPLFIGRIAQPNAAE